MLPSSAKGSHALFKRRHRLHRRCPGGGGARGLTPHYFRYFHNVKFSFNCSVHLSKNNGIFDFFLYIFKEIQENIVWGDFKSLFKERLAPSNWCHRRWQGPRELPLNYFRLRFISTLNVNKLVLLLIICIFFYYFKRKNYYQGKIFWKITKWMDSRINFSIIFSDSNNDASKTFSKK